MGGKILGRAEKAVKCRIEGAKRIIFFLDYDGTLTPIRRRPALARIKEDTKSILKYLARAPWSEVFIISGRALKDIRALIGIKHITYAGNHGIELNGPGLRYVHKSSAVLKTQIKKAKRLLKRLVRTKGIIIEDKAYTLSVHYRMVPDSKVPYVKDTLTRGITRLLDSGKIKVTEGKKVIEIRPSVEWNKGSIVKWVLRRRKGRDTLPICVGDDKTDEDAFRALGNKGISLVVGKKKAATYARYRLSSTRDVSRFLKWVINIKKDN